MFSSYLSYVWKLMDMLRIKKSRNSVCVCGGAGGIQRWICKLSMGTSPALENVRDSCGGWWGECSELPGTTCPVWLSTRGLRRRLKGRGGAWTQHVGMFGSNGGLSSWPSTSPPFLDFHSCQWPPCQAVCGHVHLSVHSLHQNST